MPSVTVRVPAKINIALSVGERRPDGFHDLATIFHAVSLYDEVVARPAEDFPVTTEGVGAELVPRDGSNLAVRAAQTLAAYSGITPRGTAHRRSSRGCGMDGGSDDAAAAMVACEALWAPSRRPSCRSARSGMTFPSTDGRDCGERVAVSAHVGHGGRCLNWAPRV